MFREIFILFITKSIIVDCFNNLLRNVYVNEIEFKNFNDENLKNI